MPLQFGTPVVGEIFSAFLTLDYDPAERLGGSATDSRGGKVLSSFGWPDALGD